MTSAARTTPATPAGRLDTGHAVSADGTRIGWQRTGHGPPLVLLHGTSGDRSGWSLSSRYLERTFTLYAVDRRGRGLSGDGPTYAFEREVEDVAAILDTLGEPAHLVGHSYGAVLAMAAATGDLPVRSLVLYEPPLAAVEHVDLPGVADACDAAIAAGDRDACLAAFYGSIGELGRLEMMRGNPRVYERFLRDAHTIAREVRTAVGFSTGMAAGIDLPTRLLLGSESRATFRDPVARLSEVIPGSEVTVLEGQTHLAQAFAPETFAAAILEFLDRH